MVFLPATESRVEPSQGGGFLEGLVRGLGAALPAEVVVPVGSELSSGRRRPLLLFQEPTAEAFARCIL